MVKRRTAVRFRAYPTGEQQQQIIRTIGCARLVYNLMLERILPVPVRQPRYTAR